MKEIENVIIKEDDKKSKPVIVKLLPTIILLFGVFFFFFCYFGGLSEHPNVPELTRFFTALIQSSFLTLTIYIMYMGFLK